MSEATERARERLIALGGCQPWTHELENEVWGIAHAALDCLEAQERMLRDLIDGRGTTVEMLEVGLREAKEKFKEVIGG